MSLPPNVDAVVVSTVPMEVEIRYVRFLPCLALVFLRFCRFLWTNGRRDGKFPARNRKIALDKASLAQW